MAREREKTSGEETEAQSAPPLFQCVPNFSEGRRQEVIEAIAAAIVVIPGAHLIDYSADTDHNRCVMTLLGETEAIRAAALAAARVAVAQIDLRTHIGVHPRTGAVDVLPVVPLNAAKEQAVTLAHSIGSDLAAELALPVYFYEWAAQAGRHSALPELRKAEEEKRRRGEEETVPSHIPPPDLGPPVAHPSAGIAIVGARGPLVAYNINLETADIEIARAVARRLREERERLPELEGVRALGLYLFSQNRVQVSMNLTRPARTPLPAVFAFVQEEAAKWGAAVYESEIIGAIPEASLGGRSPESILWRAYKPRQILETWLPLSR